MAEITHPASDSKFKELVEHCLAGIMLIQDDEIIYRNPEQKRLFGPLPAGFRPNAFLGVHPEDLLKVEEAYGMVSRGEAAAVDVDFRFYPQGREGNARAMKWVFCRASRIEYQGRDTVLVNMIDITRNRELEQIIRIEDKMASLGRVAAGIAHEIRNPLAGIGIYLDTLAKIHARGENLNAAPEIIAQAQAAAGKIEEVIRRVTDFARPGQPRLALTAVNEPVEKALALCVTALRRDGIRLEKSLAKRLPRCRLDCGLMEQVLVNLLTNAVEAMRHAEKRVVSVATALANDEVLIRVGDSGPGIAEEYRELVFEPFYTTKADGTGIGLSLCRRIIDDHQGRLAVGESALGGAEFVIALKPVPGQDE